MNVFNRNMIIYKTPAEIETMREAAQVVSRTLGMIAREIGPGVTPKYLDQLAEDYIRSQKSTPGFLGLYGCPSTILVSVNEQVVHGLPTERPFEEGDVVSVDCGAVFDNRLRRWLDCAYINLRVDDFCNSCRSIQNFWCATIVIW